METETRKQIMWNEHAERWTPPGHQHGPWTSTVPRKPDGVKRLVWAEITKGTHTETRLDCGWVESHK